MEEGRQRGHLPRGVGDGPGRRRRVVAGGREDRARATYIRTDIQIHRAGVENLRCKQTGIRLWPEDLPQATMATPRERCRCEGCSLARRHRRAALGNLAQWRHDVVDRALLQILDFPPAGGWPSPNSDGGPPRVRFRGGFAEVLICHAYTVAYLMGEIFARAPIRHVEVAGLVRHPGRGVMLYEEMSPASLWALLAEPGRHELRFDHTATAREEISRRLVEHGRRERDRIWGATTRGV